MKPQTFYMTKAGFQLLTLLFPPGIQMHTTHTTSGFLLAPVTFFIFLVCCPCLRIFPVLSLIIQGMWLISGCGEMKHLCLGFDLQGKLLGSFL